MRYFFNASGNHLIPDEVLKGPIHEFIQFVRLADPDAIVIRVFVNLLY